MSRGMGCKLMEEFEEIYHDGGLDENEFNKPWWRDHPKLIESHRRALIAKMPEYYQVKWPELVGGIDYWWPTQHGGGNDENL